MQKKFKRGKKGQKHSGEGSAVPIRGTLNESQRQCLRSAFTPSFSRNDRVRVRGTTVDLPGHSFFVVERTISGRDESVYQSNKSVWEHVPRGQVCVFAADAPDANGSVAHRPVGWLEGLRKFSVRHVPYGPLAALRGRSADSGAVARTTAAEMIDGECGHLSAVALPDGSRYWLVGSRAAHLLVRFEVPEADIAANRDAYAQARGGAGEPHAQEAVEERERDVVPVRVARLWRETLRGLVPERADALHAYLCDPPRTACFDAILGGTGRLVDYGATEALRFYAVTCRNGAGLCLAPGGAAEEEKNDTDKESGDRLMEFGLDVVPRGGRVALDAPEYALQCNAVAQRLNSKGAVVYGMNEAGTVVRMWRVRAPAHVLERAAQEAIVTHGLCGAELRAQLQRKLSRMPQDVRACLGEWESTRIPQLVEFAAWLRLTGRIAPRKDLSALRGIRNDWVALQRMCAASTNADSERARLREYEMPARDAEPAPPDVVICAGPQGCGKSTFARSLCALLQSAGFAPCWLNQDELGGSRGAFLAALRHAHASGRYSHLVVDKINLDGEARADYAALNIRGLTLAWAHTDGARALADVCVARVCQRGEAHRQFTPKALAAKRSGRDKSRRGQGEHAHEKDETHTDNSNNNNNNNNNNIIISGNSNHHRNHARKQQEEDDGVAQLRRIVRSSAQRYQLPTDGPLVEVNVCDPRECAVERAWAALRLYGKADLPPLEALDVPAALGMAQRYEEVLRADPRRVLYAAIQMENPEAIKALVPHALTEGKIEQEAFHITTKYFGGEADPTMLMRLSALLGKHITVTLTRIVSDSKGTAIVVRNENEFPCANTYAHITIANAKGIPAKYSNELIAASIRETTTCVIVDLPEGTTASGKFAFVYK